MLCTSRNLGFTRAGEPGITCTHLKAEAMRRPEWEAQEPSEREFLP